MRVGSLRVSAKKAEKVKPDGRPDLLANWVSTHESEWVKPDGHPNLLANRAITNERDHLELHALLGTLVRRKWLIIWPLLISLLGLWAYFSITPKYYSATAQILIDVQKPRFLIGESVVPSLDTTRFMIAPVIDSQLEIMRSTRIAERVIKKVKLQEDPEYQDTTTLLESISDFLLRPFGDSSADAVEKEEDQETAADGSKVSKSIPSSLVGTFLKQLDVRRKGQTLILLVNFTHKRPARAAEIANAVVEEYLGDQNELQLKAARKVNDLLHARVAELREQVLVAELKLQEYREANDLISIGGRTVGEQEITETIAQLIAARTQAGNKLAELQQIKQMSQNPKDFNSISMVLNSGVISNLRMQAATIMRTLASTASKFGEGDQRLEISRAELANLQQDIDTEVSRIIENARLDYDVAQAQVKILEQGLSELKQKSVRANRLSIELSELERDAKSTRDLYLNLLSRLKETLVQESLLYPDARIVESAVKPRVPSSPKKLITMALALVGSLGFGVTLAFMRDQLSSVVRTPREVEQLLGNAQTIPLPMVFKRRRQDLNTFAVDQPDSLFAQAIFSVNQAIWSRQKRSNSRRIVAITSALDGEGKSTLAANLANYSTMLNTETLLVNCNFRNPCQFKLRGDKKSRLSLADVLQGKATTNDDLDDVVEQVAESGLFILRAPEKGTVSHTMELLSSNQMQSLLKRLRLRFQLIILDTSALLPSVDARALIDFADCSIFIVEAEKTTSEQILQAHQVARNLADKTTIVVLNKSESEY